MQTKEGTWVPNDTGQVRGRWIQTYGGGRFYPQDPQDGEVSIYDIAHSLSQICRFNGHTTSFYSVAQHSIVCSRLANDDEVAYFALLHDAAEAYVGDMMRPLKWSGQELGRLFREQEAAVERAISQRFGLVWTEELRKEVKRLDDVALAIEAYHLMTRRSWIAELYLAQRVVTPRLDELLVEYKPWVEQVPMPLVEQYFLHSFRDLRVQACI